MQKFTATRHLNAGEVKSPGVVDNARQAAFREALQLAMRADGPPPQDHSIDEAERPDGVGGTVVEVTVTLPD